MRITAFLAAFAIAAIPNLPMQMRIRWLRRRKARSGAMNRTRKTKPAVPSAASNGIQQGTIWEEDELTLSANPLVSMKVRAIVNTSKVSPFARSLPKKPFRKAVFLGGRKTCDGR